MPIVPDLILDEAATKFLCAEPVTSLRQVMPEADNVTEPLNNDTNDDEGSNVITNSASTEVELGSDDAAEASSDKQVESSADSTMTPSDKTTNARCTPPPSVDVEAPATDESPVSPLGVSTPNSNDDAHALAKTKSTLEKTMKDAEKVVKKAVKETKIIAEKTAELAEKTKKEAEEAAKKAAKEAEKTVKDKTKELANFPHDKATSHWFHLSIIILIHALGPVAFSLPTFMPKQKSVNLGLSHNRGFLYGTHTLTELFILAAFVSTCHYAIEVVEIPLGARAVAVLVGLSVGKLVLAFIGEAWWSPHADPVFPIPFSFIVTTVFSLPFSLLTLWLMTPNHDVPEKDEKLRKKFRLLFGTLGAYILSLLAACCWGAVFRVLAGRPIWQAAWGVAIHVIEAVFKILLTTNLTVRLNPQKWIQLTLVVDLIFASVQTAMSPYFASWWSVIVAVIGTMAAIAWRAYGGFDRLKVFWKLMKDTVSDSSSGAAGKAKEVGAVGLQVVRDSTTNIHAMSLRMIGNRANVESETEWDEEIGEAKLERSGTADTEDSFDDSIAENEKDPGTPETVQTEGSDDDESTRDRSDPRDLRGAFARMKSKPTSQRDSQLIQRDGKQRHMYHIVDSVSSAVLITVVRIAGLITLAMIRAFTARENLNTGFQLDNRQYHLTIGYALMFIIGIILVILGVGWYIQKGLKLGGLTLNRVISYVFRDSFWFFFFWFCIQQHLMIAIQLNHYGADYECKFEWLTCREPGLMEWPGCVPMEPSV